MKLSIIIPVYRNETTLERCLTSVVGQTFRDWELILVDDGSPDGCPQLCDEWARRDPRIHVVHKENGGLSDARNAGIRKATGDYLTFVDSDDYVEEGTYRALMNVLAQHPEYDLLEYPFNDHAPADYVYTNANDYWLKGEAYRHSYAWNKIYRRKLFDNVRFPVGKVFEDVYTLPRLLEQCRTVATTNKGCYHYTINPKGITQTAGGQELSQLLDAHVEVLKKGFPMADDNYYMHVVNIQMDVIEQLGTQPVIPPFKVAASRVNGAKQRLKAVALNILGINTLCQFNKYLHKVRRRH